MADFNAAYDKTMWNEGGWQNNPHDTGNDAAGRGTYKGIASAKQPKWKGWTTVKTAIDQIAPQPPYDSTPYNAWVRRLNLVLAADTDLQQLVRDFYRVNFWDLNRLSELASQAVADRVFDSGVNQGTGTAARLLQKCLGVEVDGSLGPLSIAAANKRDGSELAEAFRAARIENYQQLAKAQPKYAQFHDTWLERC